MASSVAGYPENLGFKMRNPDTQFQIGEDVLYLPEGVRCKVDGYVWAEGVGEVPRVVAYRLSCGVSVSENCIIRQL